MSLSTATNPMVMIDPDHGVLLKEMTDVHVRRRIAHAVTTETTFALIDELTYWAAWLGNDLLERQVNKISGDITPE